mgnify:FL=1
MVGAKESFILTLYFPQAYASFSIYDTMVPPLDILTKNNLFIVSLNISTPMTKLIE